MYIGFTRAMGKGILNFIFFKLNWDIGIQRKLKDSGVMDAVTNMNVKKKLFCKQTS